VLKQIGDNFFARDLVVQTIQSLAPKLTDAQVPAALDTVLQKISQSTQPYELRALPAAVQSLTPRLSTDIGGWRRRSRLSRPS
jgi:hypothetical protein